MEIKAQNNIPVPNDNCVTSTNINRIGPQPTIYFWHLLKLYGDSFFVKDRTAADAKNSFQAWRWRKRKVRNHIDILAVDIDEPDENDPSKKVSGVRVWRVLDRVYVKDGDFWRNGAFAAKHAEANPVRKKKINRKENPKKSHLEPTIQRYTMNDVKQIMKNFTK